MRILAMASKQQTEHVLASLGRNDIEYYLNTFDGEGSSSSVEERKDLTVAQELVRNSDSILSTSRILPTSQSFSELNPQENSTFERPAILELPSEKSTKLQENPPSFERQKESAKTKRTLSKKKKNDDRTKLIGPVANCR